jgi:hypothetical protein
LADRLEAQVCLPHDPVGMLAEHLVGGEWAVLEAALAQEIMAVVQAWRRGALSRDSMMELFRRGEALSEGRTNEEEVRLVEVGGPRDEGRNPKENQARKAAR